MVAAVGKELLQKREPAEQCYQQRNAAVAILDIGGCDHAVQEQALWIDQNVPFFAFNLLSS